MPVREIFPYSEDGDGLDFGEFWGDTGLVTAALSRFADALQPDPTNPPICYCLRIVPVHDTDLSYFKPYGDNGLLINSTARLPPTIPYRNLLISTLQKPVWPVLAEWYGKQSSHPSQIANAVWHVEVRLKRGDEFVGFFKAASLSGPLVENLLKLAYRNVKNWLDAVTFERRRSNTWSLPDAKASLDQMHQLIEADVRAGQVLAAVQRIATLLTCHLHLGAGFNRAIFLAPTQDKQNLICRYAHGGDCSDAWSAKIQLPLAQNTDTIQQLQGQLKIPPDDDPLYLDLAGNEPFILRNVRQSSSVVAGIWQHQGDLEWLPRDNAIEDGPAIEQISPQGMVSFPPLYNLAVRLDYSDPLFVDWRTNRPASPWLESRNGTIFVVPWYLDGSVIGLWLFDLSYWRQIRLGHDVLPRLKAAKEILGAFAHHFRGVAF